MSPLLKKAQPKGWMGREEVVIIAALLCGFVYGVMLGYGIAL